MFPRIHTVPRSAAHFYNRIEISPSRRAALLWFTWLLGVCCAMLLAVALPLAVRLAICAAVLATCVPVSWSCILIRGPRAIRRLEWSAGGPEGEGFTASFGRSLTASPADLAAGSFRLGNEVLVLRLATSMGVRFVLIDSATQDSASFRRLCRRLKTHPRRSPPGPGQPS